MKNERLLKQKHMTLKPHVQVGKKGLTKESIEEIKSQLKKKKTVKVKFLRSAVESMSKKELALKLAEMTGSEIIGMTGFVVILHKESMD